MAHRLLHHSILGSRVMMRKKKSSEVRHVHQSLELIVSVQGLRCGVDVENYGAPLRSIHPASPPLPKTRFRV